MPYILSRNLIAWVDIKVGEVFFFFMPRAIRYDHSKVFQNYQSALDISLNEVVCLGRVGCI